ncbi:MAG TPA: hypothetical protein VF268_07735 [Gammaproteobacteria bacterium]
MNRQTTNRAGRFCALLMLLVPLCIPMEGHAISDCAIGLMHSMTVPAIDGEESGGEWSDGATATLDSDDITSCLDPLKDYVEASDTYPDRNVTVKSKRYQRGADWYMGFLFTVRDFTADGDCAGALCVGETLVIQFNPNINGDDNLAVGEDKRIVFNHKWQSSGGDPDLVTGVSVNTELAVADALCMVTGDQFGPPSMAGINYAIRKGIVGGGYSVEFEVPVSFIEASGVLTEDIGIAFAVINEFGKDSFAGTPDYDCTSGSGSCEAAGAGFPNALPIINGENPVDADCELGWTIPRQWGVAYLEEPPGSYSISRSPEYWRSDAIRVYECDSLGYTYYPDQPCGIRIEADIVNTGAVVTKKVAFLWAKHGTGDPAEYNFIDIEDVVLDSGTSATPVSTTIDSGLWEGMPTDQANHPCLRVYIFPDSLTPADQAILEGTATGGVVSRTQLNNLVSDYGVDVNHWAQKNISRHSTQTSCPNADCRVASSGFFHNNGLLISAANAQNDDTLIPGHIVDGDNGSTFVTDDLVQYSKDHVMVQVSTIAYKLLPNGVKPKYSLIQDFGGIVQVYPLAMLQENPNLPLEFLISNYSDDTMRIKLLTELYKPNGSPNVKVDVGERVITLQPRSEITVQGKVINTDVKEPGGPGECTLPAFLCDLPLIYILLIVLLLAVIFVIVKKLRSGS